MTIDMHCTVRMGWFVLCLYYKMGYYTADGGHVLFIPSPSGSHIGNALHIAREMARLSHRSSIIIPQRMTSHPLLKQTYIETIISDGLGKLDMEAMGINIASSAFNDTSTGRMLTRLSTVYQYSHICEYIMQDEQLLLQLKKIHVDIAVILTPWMDTCVSTLPYKLSIPFVTVVFEPLDRIPQVPSVTPLSVALPFTDHMSFTERLINSFLYGIFLFVPDPFTPNNVVAKYAPERPFITNKELNARCELVLIDRDVVLNYQVPLYQNQIPVGGITARPATTLTGRLGDFMASATNGAVIISFGTIVNTLPAATYNVFLETMNLFSGLKFVMKAEQSLTTGNVMTMPWLPQNDILGHNNTKLFITHCGANGLFEAIYHGVPQVGIPLTPDAPNNGAMLQQKGYGVVLLPTNITAHSLHWAIREVLENPMYKRNVAKASAIIKSRPDTSSERAAYWIDHAMVHGGHYLRPRSALIPYYQYLLIDVLLAMLLLLLIVFYVCKYSFKKCICRHTSTVNVKQKSD